MVSANTLTAETHHLAWAKGFTARQRAAFHWFRPCYSGRPSFYAVKADQFITAVID